MSKTIRMGVLLFLITFTFELVLCGDSLAHTTYSLEQFKNYLEKQSDPESVQLKEQFSQIPLKKQQKIIKYYCDPDIMRDIYSQDVAPNSKKVLYNGDVVLEDKTTISEEIVEDTTMPSQTAASFLSSIFFSHVFAAPVARDYSIRRTVQIGIVCSHVKYTSWVKYRVVNGKAKNIITAGATADKFMVPNPISRTHFSKYIYGNAAYCVAAWQMSLPLLKNSLFDISPVDVTRYFEIRGLSNGKGTWKSWV